MRLPLLFRRENSQAARQARQEELERAVSDGLRKLGEIFSHAAELIEKRRLERKGYSEPHTFLKRTDGKREP